MESAYKADQWERIFIQNVVVRDGDRREMGLGEIEIEEERWVRKRDRRRDELGRDRKRDKRRKRDSDL